MFRYTIRLKGTDRYFKESNEFDDFDEARLYSAIGHARGALTQMLSYYHNVWIRTIDKDGHPVRAIRDIKNRYNKNDSVDLVSSDDFEICEMSVVEAAVYPHKKPKGI